MNITPEILNTLRGRYSQALGNLGLAVNSAGSGDLRVDKARMLNDSEKQQADVLIQTMAAEVRELMAAQLTGK